MAQTDSQWLVLGHDVRDSGRLWLAAWRDFLWADDSPVMHVLDDMVSVQRGDTIETYQGGRQIHGNISDIKAAELPADLVLVRTLSLPAKALPNLAAVIKMEVIASSPFADSDTSYGWIQRLSGDDTLSVTLAIAQRSAVMAHLSHEYDTHEPRDLEVWVNTDEGWIVLEGYGEPKRQSSYRKRLYRVAGYILAALLALLLVAFVHLMFKKLELSQIEALATVTEREAVTSLGLRDRLAAVNATVGEVNSLLLSNPNPHAELQRLTNLLPDDAFVQQFQISGREIRLRGRAVDAAALMQKLTEEPAYASVTAPQAITRVAGSSAELFYLNIVLAGGPAE